MHTACSWNYQIPLLYPKHVSTHPGLFQEVQYSICWSTRSLVCHCVTVSLALKARCIFQSSKIANNCCCYCRSRSVNVWGGGGGPVTGVTYRHWWTCWVIHRSLRVYEQWVAKLCSNMHGTLKLLLYVAILVNLSCDEMCVTSCCCCQSVANSRIFQPVMYRWCECIDMVLSKQQSF